MGLPFSMPGYVQNPKAAWEKAVEIECYNLCTECLGGVLVDEKFWLEGYEASGSFFLIPANVEDEIPFELASFYADCIGFEHEFGALAIPPVRSYLREEDIPWPAALKTYGDLTPADMFVGTLQEAGSLANKLWNGLEADVVFKYDWIDYPTTRVNGYDVVKVSWMSRFNPVQKAIHLYCTALRQTDPLAAFLCFYRVIENCTRQNGKAWIESKVHAKTLQSDSTFWCDAPPDLVVPDMLKAYVRDNNLTTNARGKIWTNLIELLRGLACQRIDELSVNLSPKQITARFYSDNRCGIAHGQTIRSHDLANDLREILRDLKLMRFLARIAIEEQISKTTLATV